MMTDDMIEKATGQRAAKSAAESSGIGRNLAERENQESDFGKADHPVSFEKNNVNRDEKAMRALGLEPRTYGLKGGY